MLHLEDIVEIRKAHNRSGYEIVFPENRIIWVTKRRTLAGLLLLIKYEYCSEADLVGTNERLSTIKSILKGKIDPSWIQVNYGQKKAFHVYTLKQCMAIVSMYYILPTTNYYFKKMQKPFEFN